MKENKGARRSPVHLFHALALVFLFACLVAHFTLPSSGDTGLSRSARSSAGDTSSAGWVLIIAVGLIFVRHFPGLAVMSFSCWAAWYVFDPKELVLGLVCICLFALTTYLAAWWHRSENRQATKVLPFPTYVGLLARGKGWYFYSLFFAMSLWVTLSVIPLRATTSIVATPIRVYVEREIPGHLRSIGMALSGGGYRAALFHAGVLHEMMETRLKNADSDLRFADRVDVMSSVSGGSIIGGYYCCGGNPKRFLEFFKAGGLNVLGELCQVQTILQLILSLKVQVNGKEYGLSPWDPGCSRVERQAQLFEDTLVGRTKMSDLGNGNRPELMICATDLASGDLIGVLPYGFVRSPLIPLQRLVTWPEENLLRRGLHWLQKEFTGLLRAITQAKERPNVYYQSFAESPPDLLDFTALSHQAVAQVMAASGAFPGAFNAHKVPIQSNESSIGPGAPHNATLYLADGGIRDNYGLRLMAGLIDPEESEALPGQRLSRWMDTRIVLVSDASAPFRKVSELASFEEVWRAASILYANAETPVQLSNAVESYIVFSPHKFLPHKFVTSDGVVRITPDEILFPLVRAEQRGTCNAQLPSFRDLGQETALKLVDLLPEENPVEPDDFALERFFHLEPRRLLSDGRMESVRLFHRRILDDIGYCLEVFYTTSTLEDARTIDPEEADALFRLGRYAAFLNLRNPACKELLDASDPRP